MNDRVREVTYIGFPQALKRNWLLVVVSLAVLTLMILGLTWWAGWPWWVAFVVGISGLSCEVGVWWFYRTSDLLRKAIVADSENDPQLAGWLRDLRTVDANWAVAYFAFGAFLISLVGVLYVLLKDLE